MNRESLITDHYDLYDCINGIKPRWINYDLYSTHEIAGWIDELHASIEVRKLQAIKDAARSAAATAKKVAAAERATLKAIAESSKPMTARTLRMASKKNKTRKN